MGRRAAGKNGRLGCRPHLSHAKGPTRMRSQAPSSARSEHAKAPAEGAKFRGLVHTRRASCKQAITKAGVKEGFEKLLGSGRRGGGRLAAA